MTTLFDINKLADEQWCFFGGHLWKTLTLAGWITIRELPLPQGRAFLLRKPKAAR
jgi:hypothetical protein